MTEEEDRKRNTQKPGTNFGGEKQTRKAPEENKKPKDQRRSMREGRRTTSRCQRGGKKTTDSREDFIPKCGRHQPTNP